jgi:hypothetical protein
VNRALDRPARVAGWQEALARGFIAFLVMAGVALVASVGIVALTDVPGSFGIVLRIAGLYLGPFHHIPVVVEGDLDLSEIAGTGAELPSGSSTIEVGVALLAATWLAAWLLFRAGLASAEGRDGGALAAAVSGAFVAPGYAVPVLLVALLVEIEAPLELGSFVSGEVRLSLSAWPALLVPLVLAALAGAAGGWWAWARSHRGDRRTGFAAAAIAGGWWAFALSLLLTYAGLVVAGIAQPGGQVALLTPTTARYYQLTFDRPEVGTVVLVHHLAVAPNEALWALVPTLGGCDDVRARSLVDLACFGRAQRDPAGAILGSLQATGTGGSPTPSRLPPGYLLLVLAPAAATIAGGRAAAIRAGRRGVPALRVGAATAIPFAVLVGVGCVLSTITIGVEAILGSDPREGVLRIGPDVVPAVALALVWGLAGGSVGSATAGWFRARPESSQGR